MLKKMLSEQIDVPMIIDGREVRNGKLAQMRCPHDHRHILGTYHEANALYVTKAIDAAFFLLYGIERNDVEYILSTFAGIRKESESMFEDTSTAERVLSFYDKLKSAFKQSCQKLTRHNFRTTNLVSAVNLACVSSWRIYPVILSEKQC
jgi:hypothetical protein